MIDKSRKVIYISSAENNRDTRTPRREHDVSTFFELLQLGSWGEDEKSAIGVTMRPKIGGTLILGCVKNTFLSKESEAKQAKEVENNAKFFKNISPDAADVRIARIRSYRGYISSAGSPLTFDSARKKLSWLN